MSTVAEIESAISTLPVKDAWSVAGWLRDYLDAKWDKEMDEDIAAGRLDPLWEKAKADIAAGRVKPLDEVINHGGFLAKFPRPVAGSADGGAQSLQTLAAKSPARLASISEERPASRNWQLNRLTF